MLTWLIHGITCCAEICNQNSGQIKDLKINLMFRLVYMQIIFFDQSLKLSLWLIRIFLQVPVGINKNDHFILVSSRHVDYLKVTFLWISYWNLFFKYNVYKKVLFFLHYINYCNSHNSEWFQERHWLNECEPLFISTACHLPSSLNIWQYCSCPVKL